jgi:predicted kinase
MERPDMEAVIFIGVQASGKTTFYRERFFDTHVRISLDMLRTRTRERIMVQACLNARQPFVVDNTNVLATERARYILAARAAGFRVTGYYFRTELRPAIWRNKQRTGKQAIPVAGVIGTFKKLQPPALEEGFDELYFVELTKEGEFVVASSA